MRTVRCHQSLLGNDPLTARPTQLSPRTGDQGSTRTEGVNFCRRNHAPVWFVLTSHATRSPKTLIGSSRSSLAAALSASGCCDAGTLAEYTKMGNGIDLAPST